MTRYDAVNYISHGIAKRAGMSESRPVRGVDEDAATVDGRGDAKKKADALDSLLRQPQREGEGRPDRSADRPRRRIAAHDPGAVPPAEEQPALRRRSRRRQDRDRRRPRQAHRRGRRARGAQGFDHLRARYGRAARRHALSRRFRRAAEAGREGDRGLSRRDHVHRRDPHRHRCGRDLGRRDGRLEPSEAGAGRRRDPLHRLDHLQGISPVLREGPGAGSPLPEDRRQRAVGARRDRDPARPEALFRGLPQGPLHQRRDQDGGRTVGALHQ